MKIKILQNGKRLFVERKKKIHTINLKKLKAVLEKIGLFKYNFTDIQEIENFLNDNELTNQEFIEFISSENH